ncbi:MAG: Asp-tRNA(Asn)/Glu-tRNA(Gln) amidotransferase subunit GatA [Proteobacteria bacterium]|nr:Asp-tRNA(Asn)/Glu-tRNA(Gln) amidotransferase subunit GatA [Pseudomonadota bacterium]
MRDGLEAQRLALRAGRVTSTELTRGYLERAAHLDPKLNAYIHLDARDALEQAARADERLERGQAGVLAGIPIGIKDNLCTQGIATSCGSRLLEGYIPPYDAGVIERLRTEDAVLIGKLNMDEFAMGSSNENSAFGPVKNPWDLGRTPGGSSGGPAAAVAARLCSAAIGSDTGGSVRQPAAYCGLSALRPTYGRVSRSGLVAFASSLDQVGPIARSARDTACLLRVIAGHDPRDATSADAPSEDYEAACGHDVRGLRVGVVRQCLSETKEAAVALAVQDALAQIEKLGCTLLDVSLPHARYAVAAYYIVAPAEASSNLARFDGLRYGNRADAPDLHSTYARTRANGFGTEVKRRIMLGTYALSAGYYEAYYLKAQKVRTLIVEDFKRAFQHCDVLITPTAPTVAFELGKTALDPLEHYLQDIFTLPASLAGIPAMSVPCGLAPERLPIGLQLCGPAFSESRLLALAHALEQSELAADVREALGSLP